MSEEKGVKHPLADAEIVKVNHISNKESRSEIAVVYKDANGHKKSQTFHLINGRDVFGRVWR